MKLELQNALAEVEILTTAQATNVHQGLILSKRRRRAMWNARQAGAMYEDIAQAAGITRQRVHQLIGERTP